MAPLGILTAITAAIRVGGPPWMKAVIGRARENYVTIELELMSSTSHEVCELWNGNGVIRMIGEAKVQPIIYLEDYKSGHHEESYGLFTVEQAVAANILCRQSIHTPIDNKKHGKIVSWLLI